MKNVFNKNLYFCILFSLCILIVIYSLIVKNYVLTIFIIIILFALILFMCTNFEEINIDSPLLKLKTKRRLKP